MQLNMWGGRLENQILDLVRAEDPDVLCLQEAIDLKGGQSAMFVTVEEIQEAMGADYIFNSPVFTLNYMSRKANFGNTIISKFPITQSETIFTGRKYIADFELLNHSPNMRNLQHAVLALPDKSELHVLNHHGHHINQHKNGDAETMRQCGLIAEEVKKLDGRVILTGDFNLAPHSESLVQINSILMNLSIKAGLSTTRTQLTHKKEVCDYIFTGDKIKVKAFKALDEIVSDHKALVLSFE